MISLDDDTYIIEEIPLTAISKGRDWCRAQGQRIKQRATLEKKYTIPYPIP